MADVGGFVTQDHLSCPICLDVLKEPVTTPCGHSYCLACIENCWNQVICGGSYKCPQCRKTFASKPDLGKNTILSKLVENLKKTELIVPVPAGPGDVECDVCTEMKYKAVKSCLVCQASYCKAHLQPHYISPAFKKHKLVEASRCLEDQICSQHERLLEVYCRSDQKCICMLCTMDEHKGHDTVSAAAERTEKQKQLVERQRELQQGIQKREKNLKELRSSVEAHKSSAQTAVQNIQRNCNELIKSIERKFSKVTKMIQDQEKAAVSQAEDVVNKLEQEIKDLKRRDAELQKLSHTEDHIFFLENFQSISSSPGSSKLSSISISSLLDFDDAVKCVIQLREELEELCTEEFQKIPAAVQNIHIISPPEPQTREELLQYSRQFTLDPNTAYKQLRLSERNKVVTFSETELLYPDHPDRFDHLSQVLCKERVLGRCYWEVEWTGTGGVFIAVSYKSINRKGRGKKFVFGYNDQSWSLFCSSSSLFFVYDEILTELPTILSSRKIGVYVDHRAGTLSFYSVSDTVNLLHTIQTSFTQDLHPGFGVCSGSVTLCS